jgi:hypothetical protein
MTEDPKRKGFFYAELEKPITLQVYTKAPEKWLLVDKETGQTYQGSSSGNWNKVIPIVRNS